MPSRSFPRLCRLCGAVSKTKLDEQLASLSALQTLLAFGIATVVVLTVPPLLVDDAAALPVGVALGFGTLFALSVLLARYNQR